MEGAGGKRDLKMGRKNVNARIKILNLSCKMTHP